MKWIKISEYKQAEGKRNKVIRWHKLWKCPIAVFKGAEKYNDQWLECTLNHLWPEDAFEPFFAKFPEPPQS